MGLVAIQYAQHVGAEVYATAGSEVRVGKFVDSPPNTVLLLSVPVCRDLGQAKHEYLRSIGVKHITSSRSGARFEEEMRSFLDKERGGCQASNGFQPNFNQLRF